MTTMQAEQIIERISKRMDKNEFLELKTAFEVIATEKAIKEYHRGFDDGENFATNFATKGE